MPTIETNSNKAERKIVTEMPKILQADTLAELVEIQGEDLCVQQIKGQLTISFRSMIRTKLEAENEDGNPTYSDDDIKNLEGLADWKPEVRVRKSNEEKAKDILGALSPEERAAVLAAYAEQEKAAKKK